MCLQVDPYDYDTILFILKLVKELSPEESHTVDKVHTYASEVWWQSFGVKTTLLKVAVFFKDEEAAA